MPYRKALASVYHKLCELLGDPIDPTIEGADEEVLFKRIESQFASLQSEFVSYKDQFCLLYTSPSPRDRTRSRMPSSA